MTFTNEELIARYLYHRGKKERASKFWQKIEKGRNDYMEYIAQTLMSRMQEQGEQNIRTAAGTAYRSTKWSVTTTDKAEFVREIVTRILQLPIMGMQDVDGDTFDLAVHDVLDSDALALLDARPVKEAALAYLDAHKVPPPGINIDGFYEVHVRKS